VHLETEVWLPRARDEVFAFFSEPANLESLTPRWLHFRILTPGPIAMGRGTVIDYRIRVHGVPISWRSEISVWSPPSQFVDDQVRGPYRRWRHTHSFEQARGGTVVRDSVEFEVPLSFVVGPFVRRDVEKIFAYRSQALLERFGSL
jgi:ligand-binding SRPBCC domain-containing protein